MVTQTLVHRQDWHQHRPPPELEDLPDEAVDDAGTSFRGARARVYHLLRIVAEQRLRLPVGLAYGPPGWVPRPFLVEPWSGGASGDRRVRELGGRHGFEVEHQSFEPPAKGSSSTTIYRLVGVAESVPAPSGALRDLSFFTAIGGAVELSRWGTPFHLASVHTPVAVVLPQPSWEQRREGREAGRVADEEAYREHLLDRYHSGHLVPQLQHTARAVFYLRPKDRLPFNPFPMLRRCLTSQALGATDRGHVGEEWRE